MFQIPFVALARILETKEAAPVQCIFGPWALFALVYMATASRPLDRLCYDALKIGIHVTALAILFPHPACFACSIHSVLSCMQDLATDAVSTCAYSLLAVCALPFMAQSCSYEIQAETQLVAIAWTELVGIVHYIVWKFM